MDGGFKKNLINFFSRSWGPTKKNLAGKPTNKQVWYITLIKKHKGKYQTNFPSDLLVSFSLAKFRSIWGTSSGILVFYTQEVEDFVGTL